MIRGAARGLWRSPRQLLRASKRKGSSDTKRTVCDLTKQESSVNGSGGQHKHAFGRTTSDVVRCSCCWCHVGMEALMLVSCARDNSNSLACVMTEQIPRAMAIGVFDALNVGAIDALMLSLKDVAEDDDGR